MRGEKTNQLIKEGTDLKIILNNGRMHIFDFGDMFDFGFGKYLKWKEGVLEYLSRNKVDQTKLEFLRVSDAVSRDFLKTSAAMENSKMRSEAFDEVTKDIDRLIVELFNLRPIDKKIEIIISRTRGIYLKSNELSCYPINGVLRVSIIDKLKSGCRGASSLFTEIRGKTKPLKDDRRVITDAIKDINRLFKRDVWDEFDLIEKVVGNKYELNRKKFEILFSD